MKGIILAGGKGTRLYPLTIANQQADPAGVAQAGWSIIRLSMLMLAGIRENPDHQHPGCPSGFKQLLGDGSQWGLKFEYAEQPETARPWRMPSWGP